MDVIGREGVNSNSLSHGVHRIASDISNGVVQQRHCDWSNHGGGIGHGAIRSVQALKFAISNSIGSDAGEQFSGSAQLRYAFVGATTRDGAIRGSALIRQGIAATAVVDGQIVEHFVLGLLLRVKHLLHGQNLVDQQSVGLRNFSKELLELLDLLLSGGQLF